MVISCIQLAFRYDNLVAFSFAIMDGGKCYFNRFDFIISGIYLYPLHLSNLLQILGRYDGKLCHLSIKSYFAFTISACSAIDSS